MLLVVNNVSSVGNRIRFINCEIIIVINIIKLKEMIGLRLLNSKVVKLILVVSEVKK